MTFADRLSEAFTAAHLWAFFAILPAGALLFAAAPKARKRLLTAGFLTLGAAFSLLLAAAFRHTGAPLDAAEYRVARGVAGMFLSVAAINVLSAGLFDLLLPGVRIAFSSFVRDLLMATAYLLAALAVLSAAGVNFTGIVATSAAMTAVLAFSLQETLGNVFGGMVLHLESSFAPGDWIKTPTGDEGFVRDIRWRHTTLETRSGNTVLFPNAALMKGTVTVYGRREGRLLRTRRDVTFNVAYDNPPAVITEAVEKALQADVPLGVADDPPPSCILLEFKESCAVYALRYWLTDLGARSSTDSAVRTRIYYALARSGIKLAVPMDAVVVSHTGQELAERGHQLETARRLAALRQVEMFNSLNEEEFNALADQLRFAPFGKGEALTRQGAAANWLYILIKGEAEVSLRDDEHGGSHVVAKLGPGQLMGEMGLLTGEPRAATVVALTEVDCYRLDREGFTEIVRHRPAIADGISTMLAQRRVELEAARDHLDEAGRRLRLEKTKGDLLSRIRGLFALS